MSATYRLDWIDPTTGVRAASVADLDFLEYTKAINAPGIAKWGIRGDHPKLDRLAHRMIIEIWRQDLALGLDWYKDFECVYRAPEEEHSRKWSFSTTCLGTMSKIGHRHVFYYAKTPNRSEWTNTPIETILKQLVAYNLTALATTASGRWLNGVDSQWSIMPDQARGPVVASFGCAGENVLTAMQRLIEQTGIDIGVIRTGPLSWAFEVYPDGIGDDKRDSLIFSAGKNNIQAIKYSYNRTNEKTVAVVAGQGRDSSRLWEAAYLGSADEHIEVFVDANNINTRAGLEVRAGQALLEHLGLEQVAFTVRQAERTRYGRDYNLGTRGTGVFKGRNFDVRIASVTIRSERDKPESIEVTAATL